MKKTINFINKSLKHIILAFNRLKNRYLKVEFVFTKKELLCNGYFIVEGNGRRKLKWA